MAGSVSQDALDFCTGVYARFGTGLFSFSDICDLAPTHQYMSRLNNAGWVMRIKPRTRLHPAQWQLTEAALFQARRQE